MGQGRPAWYLLKTKRWHEEQVGNVLEGHGVEFFLPSLERGKPTRTGRWGIPLFPSYLFVRLSIPSYEYLRVRAAPGVAGLVSFASSPTVVPDGLVEAIKARVQSEDVVHSGVPLKKGERAVLAGRLFRDVEVVFDTRLTADDRVRVLLDLSMAYRDECKIAG